MNRADFKRIAELRIREAKVLLDNRLYAGAYYLAGYAVECALKACIARQTRRFDFPPEPDKYREIYIHHLGKLLKYAGKYAGLPAIPVNSQLEINWVLVSEHWSEGKRYEHATTKVAAQNLYDAIIDPIDGVLTWLKTYW